MSLVVALSDDLATCLALRRTVFIEEQKVPEAEEIDGRDTGALHLLAQINDHPVGCARLLVQRDTGKIGRVCVLRQNRGQGIGIALVQTSLEVLRACEGVTRAKLGAQTHAIGFYEKLGFRAMGPEYLDAGIAHRDMVHEFTDRR